MKKATLIHPRKLTRVMEEFLAKVMEVENLTRTVEYCFPNAPSEMMSGEEYITPKLRYRKGFNNFCVYPYDFFDSASFVVKFDYDPNALLSDGSRNYKNGLGFILADMGRRASYMKGFSQIVRIWLHELGHIMTYEQVMKKYTEIELIKLHRNTHSNENYVRLPDEYAATQWAIDWLADPNHRKIARDFEKKFWACFA